MIVSSVQGNISDEGLEDPALNNLWEAADEVMSMDKHPIKQFRKWTYRLSMIKNKKGTMLMLLDVTRILVLEALRKELLARGHQGITKICWDIAAKHLGSKYKTEIAEVCAS